jgi:hypothetical protein
MIAKCGFNMDSTKKNADWTGRGNPLWVDPHVLGSSRRTISVNHVLGYPVYRQSHLKKQTWDLRKHKILGLKCQSHKNWWYDSSKVGMLLGIHTNAQDINITNGESHHHLNVCQTYSVSGV